MAIEPATEEAAVAGVLEAGVAAVALRAGVEVHGASGGGERDDEEGKEGGDIRAFHDGRGHCDLRSRSEQSREYGVFSANRGKTGLGVNDASRLFTVPGRGATTIQRTPIRRRSRL